MKDQDKINMEIKIGGEPIRLTVPFQNQLKRKSTHFMPHGAALSRNAPTRVFSQ